MAFTGVGAMVIMMSLNGKERRILAEIEQALELEDPELAKRVAAINMIESGGETLARAYGERMKAWATAHVWVMVLTAFAAGMLLILAIATA